MMPPSGFASGFGLRVFGQLQTTSNGRRATGEGEDFDFGGGKKKKKKKEKEAAAEEE